MAFRLKQHESVDKGVRRIIRRQMDDALAALASGKPDAIHDVRLHFKKVRACLHLLRDGLGDKAYRRENRRFRDAAQPLRQLRDAEMLVETLDRLGADDVSGIRQVLQEQRQAMHMPETEHIVKMVKAAHSRMKDWPEKDNGWALLERGLKRGWRKNRRAIAEAKQHPTAENLHEWRKQAKYLWYQLLLLERAWPRQVKAWDKAFHKLTQALGDDHDLAVLRRMLAVMNADALLPLIDRRREKLQKQSFALGDRLYRDKPEAFAHRLEKHWKKWRLAH